MSRTRTLSRDEAIRYLTRREFTRREAEETVSGLTYDRGYGGSTSVIVSARRGVDIRKTADGYLVRYASQRERDEAEAIDRHVCPRCRQGTGLGCRSTVVGRTWQQPLKHPHAERIAKVRGR